MVTIWLFVAMIVVVVDYKTKTGRASSSVGPNLEGKTMLTKMLKCAPSRF